jgi:hypothetical protein
MREQLIENFKSALRPIIRHRFLLEKIKYHGETILSGQEGNDFLAKIVNKPGAAGKIGSTEIKCCRTWLRKRDKNDICHDYGRYFKWAHISAGIFPPDAIHISRFCKEYLPTLGQLDYLAIWYNFGEHYTRKRYAPQATLGVLPSLEPYYHERPWSTQLEGKRVVVISSFPKTILSQYERREKVWAKKPGILANFASLRSMRCPQIAGLIDKPEYPDWFVALDALKAELAREPFDVALIGAGGWSVPLAVHAKSLGAFGMHLGGGLQIMFGIMGRRWDNNPKIDALRNEFWTRPSDEERPKNFVVQENGCYW